MLPTVGEIVAKAKIQVLVYFRILLHFGQRVKQLFYVQEIQFFFNETTTKKLSLMPLQSSILQQYFYIKRKGLHQLPLFKLANCKRIHEFTGKKEIILLV